jgi:carbamate kinase
VIALGGNALLRQDDPLTAEQQKANLTAAAEAIAPLIRAHEVVLAHGNGPQVGLLAMQNAGDEGYPLDVLDAESEGLIGYLLEQALANVLPAGYRFATLLTQVEVDPDDPAFDNPTKPIGSTVSEEEARRLSDSRGWRFHCDPDGCRRVVPSPKPQNIIDLPSIELLMSRGTVVICAGGGGIPTVCDENGKLSGVEAVIDKDRVSALLARQLAADALLMLTDVEAVYRDWNKPQARRIRRVSPDALREWFFEAGSMGPKVQAALEFVEATGGVAHIGALKDAQAILDGEAGTLVTREISETVYW